MAAARAPSRRPAGRHPLAIAAGVLVGVGLAWAVAVHGLADGAVRDGRGEVAFARAPGSAAAAVAASGARLGLGDAVGAAAAARIAVADAPLSAAALSAAAISRLAAAPAEAARMFSFSAALGWRDVVAQVWLANAATAAGDLPGAAARLDALARTRGLVPALASTVDALAATPAGRTALATRLGAAPAWRLAYLSAPVASPGALDARVALLTVLARTAVPPTRTEVARVTRALAADGDVAGAWRVWRAVDPDDGVPRDGGFARVPPPGDASPFEWRIAPPPGASAAPGDDGLRVGSDGAAAGAVASQTLVLAPGDHVLDATTRYEGPGARDAFRWSIACGPGGRAITLPPVAGDHALQPFAIPAGCVYQTLALRVLPAGPDAVGATIRSVSIR